MGEFLQVADLTMFAPEIDPAKATQMINDAEALAVLAAPCLVSNDPPLSETQTSAVRAILRGAVLRWNEAGTGAFSQRSETRGPFSVGETFDTRQQRKAMFWPSELTQLQDICGRSSSGAFGVDMVGGSGVHAEACSVYFGAACSCGAVLTGGLPLYGY